MYPNIVDMKKFYAENPGLMVRRLVGKSVRGKIAAHPSHSILGLGYANPFLRPLVGQARRVLSFAPAEQGVIAWPEISNISSALVNETMLPLPDKSIDTLLLAHILEHTKDPNQVMAECARVVAATGKIIVIVPNRRGIWSQLERTPFGYGRPYSCFQLRQLLEGAGFHVDEISAALFTPPTQRKLLLKFSNRLELLRRWPFPRVGGVLIAEAHLNIFAPIKGQKVPIKSLVWKPQTAAAYNPQKGDLDSSGRAH